MILVDTSVWIDHLHTGDERLADLLNDLPQAPVASQDEVLHLIEHKKLMGRGIGFIDAHLLASAALSDSAAIWTRDKRLQKVARKLKLAFD